MSSHPTRHLPHPFPHLSSGFAARALGIPRALGPTVVDGRVDPALEGRLEIEHSHGHLIGRPVPDHQEASPPGIHPRRSHHGETIFF